MRYCPECGSEYQDGIERCADCPGAPALVSEARMRELGLPLPDEDDERTFEVVGPADNYFAAQVLAAALKAQGIPVMLRGRQGGTVDRLTDGLTQEWWELLVPSEQLEAARAQLEAERRRLKETEAEAERAAEEESEEESRGVKA